MRFGVIFCKPWEVTAEVSSFRPANPNRSILTLHPTCQSNFRVFQEQPVNLNILGFGFKSSGSAMGV
jgi:hypothetical protein